jgi:hypothetical protein
VAHRGRIVEGAPGHTVSYSICRRLERGEVTWVFHCMAPVC